MDLFFSPPVRTYSLLLQHHNAPSIIDQLVSTGFVQFQMNPYDDVNDPFYIIYSRIKQLKFKISKHIEEINLKYDEKVSTLSHQQKHLTIARMKQYIQEKQIDYLRYLDMQESVITQKLNIFSSTSKNYDSISSSVNNIQEQLDIVKAKLQVIKGDFNSTQFIMITGTCFRKDKYIIQRLLFRKTQGHSYIIFKERNNKYDRDIFLCFINKGIYKNINHKLNNLFIINRASLYDLPNFQEHLINYQMALDEKKKQYLHLFQISSQQFTKILKDYISGPQTSLQYHYTRIAFLERIIYIICHSRPVGSPANHHMFTIHVPQNQKLPEIPVSLIPIDKKHKNRTIMPRIPCLYEVNILTQLYSIPKYNEIIPSVFMFSTVPILFGMMFSDMGHGVMLLSIAFFLKLGPIFYFMAVMSIYSGFIYNQFFGMKIIYWDNLGIIKGQWGIAQNGMNFQNSLKMKLSMIIAFIHMCFGAILKMTNQLKRGHKKLFIYDSLPKFILMITTIGYLVYLIIAKWLTNYKGRQYQAPSIINSMIQLFLGTNPQRKTSILGSIKRQQQIASILNTISIICILVMVYNHTFRHKIQKLLQSSPKYQTQKYQKLDEEDQIKQMSNDLSQSHQNCNIQLSKVVSYYYEKEDEQNQLGPLEVFQYVLSLISSTTSYLRLFALSLAHSKLSHLLLNFLLSTLSNENPSISIIRCLVFFITTVGMMLCLDVMECLMHVVRLHWVEWMGKFYKGSGVLFQPQIQQFYS